MARVGIAPTQEEGAVGEGGAADEPGAVPAPGGPGRLVEHSGRRRLPFRDPRP